MRPAFLFHAWSFIIRRIKILHSYLVIIFTKNLEYNLFAPTLTGMIEHYFIRNKNPEPSVLTIHSLPGIIIMAVQFSHLSFYTLIIISKYLSSPFQVIHYCALRNFCIINIVQKSGNLIVRQIHDISKIGDIKEEVQAKVAVINHFWYFWINDLATFFAISLLDDVFRYKKCEWDYVFHVSFSCLFKFFDFSITVGTSF